MEIVGLMNTNEIYQLIRNKAGNLLHSQVKNTILCGYLATSRTNDKHIIFETGD